jgi:hypothetical protein
MAKEKPGIPGWIVDIMVPEKPELGIGPMAISSGPGKLIRRSGENIVSASNCRDLLRNLIKRLQDAGKNIDSPM